MKKKSKFGFLSQSYEAPRAESVSLMNEGSLLLAASGQFDGLEGGLQSFGDGGTGTWDDPQP